MSHRRSIDEAVLCLVEEWTTVAELRAALQAGGFPGPAAPRAVARLLMRLLDRGWVTMGSQVWPDRPVPVTDWREHVADLTAQAAQAGWPEPAALTFTSTPELDRRYWPHQLRRDRHPPRRVD